MTAIETALFNRLLVLVPPTTPVFLHEMPQEMPGPYVVFDVSERSDTQGTAPISTLDIQARCYAQVHSEAAGVATMVHDGLLNWFYGAPGLRLHPLAFTGWESGFEQDFGVYRSAVSFAAQAVQW